jgi:hypothetical protein
MSVPSPDQVFADTPSTERPKSLDPAEPGPGLLTAGMLPVPPEAEGVEEDWEEAEEDDSAEAAPGEPAPNRPARRKRRVARTDAEELRLLGRRALCKSIAEVAPAMLKTVKLRVLGNFLPSTRGLEDDDLTEIIRKQADKLADRQRIVAAVAAPDPQYDRGELRSLLLAVLMQEETYSLEENRLDEKVAEFEKETVKAAKALDLAELKKRDPDRWHHYDTYRIVLEAAWRNDSTISQDEAHLLRVLRTHLGISPEEHWLISALIKRFPKEKGALHTPDEVNEARKELQRAGVLWGYRDEANRNIDVVPGEVAAVIRREVTGQELQRANYRRLLAHDALTLAELREALQARGLDRSGSKADLIARLAASDVRPSALLDSLDKDKLSNMCAALGLRSSGSKGELVARLVDFYDDLTFEERVTRDRREEWYANYELLAGRKYAELRAKKLIAKDLEIQSMFEEATTYLFECRLRAKVDRRHKDNRSDGRVHLDDSQCLLWDCKSAEGPVNLQDHLDGQFDGYLRKERETGKQPLAFLVVGPSFTPQSIILAHQYKARTNWDVALVTAEGLKHLAERWAAMEPEKPFPVRLLNRTDVIDKDRAEFLLSLA